MHLLQVELPDNVYKTLSEYCEMTGRDVHEVVSDAVRLNLAPYECQPGFPVKAVYLDTTAGYEGKEPNVTEKPCYIIDDTKRFNSNYYRIIVDGQLRAVPKKHVRKEKA